MGAREHPRPRPPPIDPADVALFLDVDGTLAPIERTPDRVRPTTERTALISHLHRRLHGRVAAVSGRPVADIDRILGLRLDAVAGLHGLEMRSPNGVMTRPPTDPAVMDAARRLQAFARDHAGLLVECKGLTVALHFRARPELEIAARRAGAVIAAAMGLEVQGGAMVIELRPPGADKGDAVRTLMRAKPFVGATPIFVGDDLTDEAAFEAVTDLGGFGVLVGGDRPSAAAFGLRDVADVFGWLEDLCDNERAWARAAGHG